LEFVYVLGLVGFLIIMLLQDKDGTGLMVTLGVFVVAIFRILPSLNKVIVAFQKLHFFGNSINLFYNEIIDTRKYSESEDVKPFQFNNEISISNLSFSYNQDLVLYSVNLKIKKGDSIGFIGESGSGKSTFVDVLIGLLTPSEGLIEVDGAAILENLKGWQRKVGYVSQHINLFDRSILENIALGIEEAEIDLDFVNQIIDQVQLRDFVTSLKDGLKTNIGDRGVKLSGGQRQRLGIARALYHKPEVLIFDEATASLDSKTEKSFMESVNNFKGDLTLIMIAHRISTLSDCDKIYEVANKSITLKENKK
jgi:ABC-type bacteriocin/lantibiotic exporter with double-glycine peptidase domain